MSESSLQTLEKKLTVKSARIGIVGLGYVGLPLALAFAEAGFKVLGFDIRQGNVDFINNGKSYIADVTDERLSSLVAKNVLEATVDQSRLGEMDAVCICVPTPLTKTKDPDLSFVRKEALSPGSGDFTPVSFYVLSSGFVINGTPGGARTHGLSLRKAALYPTELQAPD